ncbi:extracellular solute-binding protein [Chthonobacter rhizosphaerae]|uniref:extracellular solute-binding protein n=1 Tax=Chthonobacter rhizosphaerae TaxID=2735553 RepID=UPI0015EE9A8F|nr:extracellular solute-binding protein [Chthonobacter rhizosphaerae]
MDRTTPHAAPFGALTRRRLLQLSGTAALAAAASLPPFRVAQAGATSHGLSVFGDLRYPPDFTHFPYANPDAPKGGRFVFSVPNWALNQDTQTFDTLHTLVLKGSAPPRSTIIYDSLMVRGLDEPDALYGLVAASVTVSDDGNTFTFALRPEARFHDGTRLTAEDAAFSYMILKEKGHPTLAEGLRELVAVEAIDAGVLELVFSGKQSLSAPLDAATYPILPKAYWEGRDFEASTLEPPLGSGPYRIGRFAVGRFIEYDLVDDYWAKDLPVNVGQNNFGTLRIEFYRERQAEFEAFKKGEIHYRQEFTSKTWATEYTFPALVEGRVVKREVPSEAIPSIQGTFFNLRRPIFSDPRTREALGLPFDFEWTNKNLFYGIYQRQTSFFQKSPYAAEGPIPPEEAALLEPFRANLPAGAFGEPVSPPVSDGSGRDRALLRRAGDLLTEAGWRREGGRFASADGKPLDVEILVESAIWERVLGPYVQNLKAIGVGATIRVVDASQYQARTNAFDFDMTIRAFNLGATPVESLDAFFHSRLADRPGSYNLSGIAHPAIDALIERAGKVKSREELQTTVRALDRVLRALHVWIPNWYSSVHRVVHWDMLGWPEMKPAYGFPVESTWWIDAAKAAAIGKG